MVSERVVRTEEAPGRAILLAVNMEEGVTSQENAGGLRSQKR